MTEAFNVLLSSAGRRVSLLNLFRAALPACGFSGLLIATDASVLSAAWHAADVRYLVPRCDAPDYIDSLLAICDRHDVRLVIPTIDTELPVLARDKRRFAARGTTIAVSSPECIEIASDKRQTNSWLMINGFPTLEQTTVSGALADPERWPLPFVAKPRNGSASIGVVSVTDRRSLECLSNHDSYLVERMAQGSEHTVDVLVNRQGAAVCAVPRRRIEVRAGEVSKGVTVRSDRMQELAMAVCERLPGAYGVFNVQMFETDTGELAITEINARFGGGFPLSAKAGADFPRWLIEDLADLPGTVNADGWKAGVGMLRYDAEVFVDLD